MKEPYEKGEAIHSAPGFAVDIARCAAKGKQGHRWAGYCASKNCHRNANAVVKAEGRRNRTGIATSGTVPRSRQEQTDAAPTFVILSGLIGMEELIARSLENKTITLMETSCSGTRDSPGSGAGPCAGLGPGPGARMGVEPPGRRTVGDPYHSLRRAHGPVRSLPTGVSGSVRSAGREEMRQWTLRAHRADSIKAARLCPAEWNPTSRIPPGNSSNLCFFITKLLSVNLGKLRNLLRRQIRRRAFRIRKQQQD